ncbi:helix-turn-helix transcriptional regulator [Paenibacillus lupini]|uniref:helix-turn-helix transcriptional regulator n=1 Tax=Paenibacillus lupini TaxID=1450204 RepID=UPI00142152ED|nr:WYL domain-containing protein [Paenibacillus lupini]NIK23289.1 putative DNA-binding transcriptional regulator YafY [Paenibacillus lupini]
MSNMHRIGWFDQQVRAGFYPNSSLLAKQFEISKRQAARDIEYMEMSLRAPLKYVAKYRGYCYEDEAFVLPHLYLSEEEQKILKYLALRYRHYNYDNAESVRRVGDLLSRFEASENLEEKGFSKLPIFDASPRAIQHMELLSEAITDKKSVYALYKDEEGERQLHVSPIRFVSRYHADYVAVHSEAEVRPILLRLDGITHLSIAGAAFGIEDRESFSKFEQGSKPARAPYLAKIRLSTPLDGNSWRGFAIQSRNELIYTVAFYDTDSFLQHLLVTEWEELIAPKWLKQNLQIKCEQITNRFRGTE